MTRYVILKEEQGEPGWVGVAELDGRSAWAVIRQYLEDLPEDGAGSFVAVPARSWKPVNVSVETKTTLKFE